MPTLGQRLSTTWNRLQTLGQKSVERPNFGQSWSPNYVSSLGYALSRESNHAHRYDLGDLSDSSLVMAVCNDTGIALAEAEPAVRKPNAKEELQRDLGHPLAELIRNPNPYHIWEDYCMAGAFSWWVDGNWYFQKIRDDAGDLLELWYLPHFMVEPRWPGDGGSPAVPVEKDTDRFISHYQYNVPNKQPVLIPAKDIVHLKRGVNLGNPRKGIGAFDPLITEIYGDKKRAQFSATVLKNMGIVVPLLAPKDPNITVGPEQAQQIKEQWVQGTTGDNVGRPMINAIALDATKFAFSPHELDLKDLGLVPESRVAAVTRYPASYLQFLVGLQHGTSYASYREAREQAYESVIAPIQNGIARRITQQILPELDDTKGAYFYFDTANVRVLQEDQDSLMKRAATGYLGEILTRADARRMLKLGTAPEDEVYRTTPAPPKNDEEPPKAFGSVAEIDQYLGTLEVQMKEFAARDAQ